MPAPSLLAGHQTDVENRKRLLCASVYSSLGRMRTSSSVSALACVWLVGTPLLLASVHCGADSTPSSGAMANAGGGSGTTRENAGGVGGSGGGSFSVAQNPAEDADNDGVDEKVDLCPDVKGPLPDGCPTSPVSNAPETSVCTLIYSRATGGEFGPRCANGRFQNQEQFKGVDTNSCGRFAAQRAMQCGRESRVEYTTPGFFSQKIYFCGPNNDQICPSNN